MPQTVRPRASSIEASMRRVDYANKNVDEATKIALAADTTGAQTEMHQKRMMGEIAKLLGASDGKLDPADYESTVSELLSGGSDPVINQEAVRAPGPKRSTAQ